MSRRDFIKTGGLGLLSAAVLGGASAVLSRDIVLASADNPGVRRKWRFVVDTTKCIGCGRCVRACKLENNLPPEPYHNRTWVERYVFGKNDEVFVDSPEAGINGFTAEDIGARYPGLDVLKTFFVPKLCNQCAKPPCVPVCPVGATFMNPDGIVLIDRKACIGCRYCIQACPYGARFFDPRYRIVDKCTWCYHRITRGHPPACVEVCPVGARTFGDITDQDGTVSGQIESNTLGVLKPEVGSEPKVYYIGLEKGVR
ncbi:MAG: 4Fe-4S dicluster domain-containing protein [Chloroflexi bacterium]|nr:4Fe-4S dicluster domain-containing protein [Chloroflexota bacterium]